MFYCIGNKNSIAGGGINYFYGKAGLDFYTQLKTVTSLWRVKKTEDIRVSVSMPTMK